MTKEWTERRTGEWHRNYEMIRGGNCHCSFVHGHVKRIWRRKNQSHWFSILRTRRRKQDGHTDSARVYEINAELAYMNCATLRKTEPNGTTLSKNLKETSYSNGYQRFWWCAKVRPYWTRVGLWSPLLILHLSVSYYRPKWKIDCCFVLLQTVFLVINLLSLALIVLYSGATTCVSNRSLQGKRVGRKVRGG